MLGMNPGFKPKFMRLFGQIGDAVASAVGNYVQEVKAVTFPSDTEHY